MGADGEDVPCSSGFASLGGQVRDGGGSGSAAFTFMGMGTPLCPRPPPADVARVIPGHEDFIRGDALANTSSQVRRFWNRTLPTLAELGNQGVLVLLKIVHQLFGTGEVYARSATGERSRVSRSCPLRSPPGS